MNSFYDNMTNRTRMVIGDETLDMLSRVSVIIFGVGGVGSWCAEGLVRSGLTNLTMVDSDIVCPTNINRQAQALARNVGESKVEEMKKRLLEINPQASITALHAAYDETSFHTFDLSSYDYVIDAIDSLRDKVLLLERCASSRVTVYSSMGAGSKTDPAKIRVALLSATTNCPLARSVRRRLRQRNVPADIMCVYSEEQPAGQTYEAGPDSGPLPTSGGNDGSPVCNEDAPSGLNDTKKRINGSLVHVTGIFGFMLTGLIINDIRARVGAGDQGHR